MLYVFGFERVGVVLSDLYFQDPNPDPGQEGAERGARLEVRFLENGEHDGTIYASRPIRVAQPIWRADLLESVDGPPGSFDRTHHHPQTRGWEPGRRKFERGLSADPLGWVADRLRDLPGLVAQAGLPADSVTRDDVTQMRESAPEIIAATGRLLERIRAGELARAPSSARASWPARAGCELAGQAEDVCGFLARCDRTSFLLAEFDGLFDQVDVGRLTVAAVELQAQMQVAAAPQGQLGDLAAAEIAADARDCPGKPSGLEHFEVRLETSCRWREPERRTGQALVSGQVELHHRAGGQPSGLVPQQWSRAGIRARRSPGSGRAGASRAARRSRRCGRRSSDRRRLR